MSEQEMQAEQAPPEEAPDWQAKYEAMRQHSRDWEKKARENQGAAEELERLRAEQMTEQERVTARAEKAEAELAQLQAASQRLEDAREVADSTGVPRELLEFCADRDSMEEFAKAYQGRQETVHAAPRARASKVNTGGDAKPSNGELFAQAAEQFFK